MTIWRTILFAFASALVAATASADLMPRTYFVPVAAPNAGAAGVSGFRTSVGVFKHAGSAQQVKIDVLDPAGNPVRERWEWISPASQRQYLLPAALALAHGVVGFINHGPTTGSKSMIYSYATVIDNSTGDGRFIGAAHLWIGDLIK